MLSIPRIHVFELFGCCKYGIVVIYVVMFIYKWEFISPLYVLHLPVRNPYPFLLRMCAIYRPFHTHEFATMRVPQLNVGS